MFQVLNYVYGYMSALHDKCHYLSYLLYVVYQLCGFDDEFLL